MEKGHSPVQSIDRLFDIVEALSNAPRGMALSDLSAAVGLHTSTTHRLLAALVARGYVQKDIESGKYRLTMRLFEVGSRAVGGMNIVSLARPYLEHLAATTHEAIHLVVRDGDEVVYLYKENMGDSTVRMASFGGCATRCTARRWAKAFYPACRRRRSRPSGSGRSSPASRRTPLSITRI